MNSVSFVLSRTFAFAAALLIFSLPQSARAQMLSACAAGVPGLEYNSNRYGGDYMRYSVTAQSCPEQCAAACAQDNRCLAWSFVRHDQVDPGCYLKNSVPPPTRNACCVSGLGAANVQTPPIYPPVSHPPSVGCAGFAGAWSMNAFGTTTLGVAADGSAAGNYTNGSGTVQGRVVGNRFDGMWAQSGRSGQIAATLAPDGASLACQWAEGGQVRGDCNATCMGPVQAPPGHVTPPITAAQCGAANPMFEYNTNRYGGDYARYAVTALSCPQQCADACANDNRCQAWSFVRHDQVDPGCYLKNSQPAPTANPCCVSGTYTRIVDRVSPPVGGEQPAGNWSAWINRDSPGDSADYEDLASVLGQVPCAQPIGIECRVIGDGRDWSQTGQRYSCALQAQVPGGICINAENNGACLDYEVRYRCP